MSIGTFTLIRDENQWIAAHLLNILPHVDEAVLFDGNSTDGTLEIIKAIQAEHPDGGKIKLHENRDCANLQGAYVELFNGCLRSLSTDLAWFAHPDFYCLNAARIPHLKDSGAVALTTRMRSFAGESGGQLYEIKGRAASWKNIYRLRNPDLGAHYHGHYGAWNEDVYFSAITGDQHILHEDHRAYPYGVEVSGLEVLHFSDVRPYARRLDRMRKCLANQGNDVSHAENHPRVTLKDGEGLAFAPAQYPAEMLAARKRYQHLERSNLVQA